MTSPGPSEKPLEEQPPPPPPPVTAVEPGRPITPAVEHEAKVRIQPTRTSMVWIGVWAGVVALILLIVFVAQNTANVRIAFFGFEGQIPLALALLIAGVAGAIIAMAVAAGRILQLRKMLRRGQRP